MINTNGSDKVFMTELVNLRPQLYARAMHLLGDTTVADDLVQDALERAIRNRGSYRNGTSLIAWVGTIMRNLAIDRWRSPIPLSIEPDTLPCQPIEPAGRDVLDLISLSDLRAAVAGLSARDRQIFELAYFQKVHHREIALKMRSRVNTIGTRLFRAKAKLRTVLEEIYNRRLAQASHCPPLTLVQSKPEAAAETRALVPRPSTALATRAGHTSPRSLDPEATPRSVGRRSRSNPNSTSSRERRPSNG